MAKGAESQGQSGGEGEEDSEAVGEILSKVVDRALIKRLWCESIRRGKPRWTHCATVCVQNLEVVHEPGSAGHAAQKAEGQVSASLTEASVVPTVPGTIVTSDLGQELPEPAVHSLQEAR